MLSIDACWDSLESHIRELYANSGSDLPAGASTRALQDAELKMSVTLPADLRTSLLRHDGSGPYYFSTSSTAGGDQRFLKLSDVVGLWQGMTELGQSFENDGEFGEQVGPVKKHYWNRRWVPIAENGGGDNVFVDLDPPKDGTIGQVVDWWHEGGVSTFIAASFQVWLNQIVDEIRSGEGKIGRSKF